MLELKIKQGRRYVPIFDLPMAMGRDAAHREIGETVEGLIAFLDEIDGDPDLEGEWSEDEISSAPSWVNLEAGPGCEIGDPSGVHDEDGRNTLLGAGADTGPGCIISDNDYEHDGQEPDYGDGGC